MTQEEEKEKIKKMMQGPPTQRLFIKIIHVKNYRYSRPILLSKVIRLNSRIKDLQ